MNKKNLIRWRYIKINLYYGIQTQRPQSWLNQKLLFCCITTRPLVLYFNIDRILWYISVFYIPTFYHNSLGYFNFKADYSLVYHYYQNFKYFFKLGHLGPISTNYLQNLNFIKVISHTHTQQAKKHEETGSN